MRMEVMGLLTLSAQAQEPFFCKNHWPYLNFSTFFTTYFCLLQSKKQRFKPPIRLLNTRFQTAPVDLRGKLRQNTGNNGQTH